MLGIFSESRDTNWPVESIRFCDRFVGSAVEEKYVLGRNIYSRSVAEHVKLSGIIDDFSTDLEFAGLPVLKTADVPKASLVLNAAGGRPISARRALDAAGLTNLDYFAFSKISRLPLAQIRFNEGFDSDFSTNFSRYEWIYHRLRDELSKLIFRKLVGFRLTHDMSYLHGFEHREDVQYFESHLALSPTNECFIDVGGYDGFTTRSFVGHCPDYSSVHVFEPDPTNFLKCQESLRSLRNVQCHPIGLADERATLQFTSSGSASRQSAAGSLYVPVDKLDDLIHVTPTFIKMDIEGGEAAALHGASATIALSHSRLAICVYHKPGDFWRIPEQVLRIRDDYDISIRHYTESIYESVMFFTPKR